MKNLKKILLMLIDFGMVAMGFFLVMFIRDDLQNIIFTKETLFSVVITGIAIVIAFNIIDFYSSLWIYTGTKEYCLALLSSLGAVSIVGISSVLYSEPFLHSKIIFASGILSIIISITYRIGIKVAYSL